MDTTEFRAPRILAALFLIVTPVAFNVFFTLLSITFEYPDILREPTGYVLQQFDAGGASLVATWYGFMLTALLFVPLAVLVGQALPTIVPMANRSPVLTLATVFGVLAGVVQFLGLIRWPLLVPSLAETYLNPAASQATKDAAAVVFDAFNQYAGVAVGEQLGYIFTALWTLLIAMLLISSPVERSMASGFRRWLGAAGALSATGILAGTLEPAGVDVAADAVAISYILWSVWLVTLGIYLLRSRGPGLAGRTGTQVVEFASQ